MNRPTAFASTASLLAVIGITVCAWAAALQWKRDPSQRTGDLHAAVTTVSEQMQLSQNADEAGWPALFGPSGNSISMAGKVNVNWPSSGPPVRWRAAVGEGYSSPVTLGDDVIVFHRPRPLGQAQSEEHGPEEMVTCFDLGSGQTRWSFRHPTSYVCQTHYSSGPYSTPVMDQDCVYAFGTEGVFFCLSRTDGTLLWKRDLWLEYSVKRVGYFPPAASPLLVGDCLIVNLGAVEANAGIIALDKNDGRTRWTATDHRAGYATPCAATIHGRRFVFVFTAEALVALDPDSGAEYWQVPFRANNPELVNATSPIVHEDIVFTSGYSVGNLCLQVLPDGSCRELWRDKRRSLDSQYNPLIAIDGCVYGFATLDDTFRCIDLKTGELRWKGLRQLERGAAIAIGDRLMLLGTRGHIASVAVDHRQLRIMAETPEPVVASPAYSFPAYHRGLLIVRNEHELVTLTLAATIGDD